MGDVVEVTCGSWGHVGLVRSVVPDTHEAESKHLTPSPKNPRSYFLHLLEVESDDMDGGDGLSALRFSRGFIFGRTLAKECQIFSRLFRMSLFMLISGE